MVSGFRRWALQTSRVDWSFCFLKLPFLEVKPQRPMISDISTGLRCPDGGVIAGSPHQEVKGEDRLQRTLQQTAGSLNIKRLFLKKIRHPESRDLVRLRIWEDAGVWAHSFHMHLACLGPPSCFHILSFLSSGVTLGSVCSLESRPKTGRHGGEV